MDRVGHLRRLQGLRHFEGDCLDTDNDIVNGQLDGMSLFGKRPLSVFKGWGISSMAVSVMIIYYLREILP